MLQLCQTVIVCPIFYCVNMHSGVMSVAFTVAGTTRYVDKCKNGTRKMLNCNENIYHNKQCLKYNVISKFADIKVKNAS